MTTSAGDTWPITYSSKVVNFINDVTRPGLVEVKWLTTWQQDAHLCLAPAIGLDAFPAYDEPEDPRHPWWKESVVRNALANDPRPCIWTDDDLTPEVADGMERDFQLDSLLIRTDDRPGLTDRQLDGIQIFLAGTHR